MLKTALRTYGNIVGLLAFPIFLVVAYLLYAYVYPTLSAATQNSIENGPGGALLGIVFGTIGVVTVSWTWDTFSDMVNQVATACDCRD